MIWQSLENVVRTLAALPVETESVEFKHNYHNPDEIGRLISALSNSAGINREEWGYLVFGVDDKTHELLGTTFRPYEKKVEKEELIHLLSNNLRPRIDFQIRECVVDGKDIVIFMIPPCPNEPVHYKNAAYIRVGSITTQLDRYPEKERKIWGMSQNCAFEDRVALFGLNRADIIRLLNTQRFFELLQIPYPTSQQGVLEKLLAERLIFQEGEEFSISNVAGILLAKDLSDFPKLSRKALRIEVYQGKNKINTLKDETWNQGYAVGFENLVQFLHGLLPSEEKLTGPLRYIQYEYPPIAVRELVANMLIHQNFDLSGTGPMVEIYEDRVEFVSPGAPLIQVNRFIDEYRSRNEGLASRMRRFRICEEKGSGIDKVIYECEKFFLPAPDFRCTGENTRAILFSMPGIAEMSKTDKIRAIYQHACLKWLSNEKMTNQSLRERLKIAPENVSMVTRLIKEAVKEGVIKEDNNEQKSKKFTKYIPFWA